MRLRVFTDGALEMNNDERHYTNFILNLCYLYRMYGIRETEVMLKELGTDIRLVS